MNYAGTVVGLTVDGGSGNDTFNVQSTVATTPVTVHTGVGQNTVNVGNNGSLAGIAGAVNVDHSLISGKTSLVINDEGESGRNATITSGGVNFTGVAPITYTDLNSLEVEGANGNNTITVNSIPTGSTVLILNGKHNAVKGPAAGAVLVQQNP